MAERASHDRKKTRNRVLNVLKVVVSLVGLAIVLLTGVDLDEVVQELVGMNWGLFLTALALFVSGALVRAYRWGALVWALDVPASWGRLVALYFVGAFFSQFLPTGVGGDAVKIYELARDDQKAAPAISSVLVDRFVGLFVLFAMALLALAGGYELVEPRERLLIAVVFGGSLVAVALLLQPTWIEAVGQRLGLARWLGRIPILRELYGSIHLYGPAALLRATAASVVWNLILIGGYYLLGLAVGIELGLWHYFLFVPIISAGLLIPSVGGLGVREGITVILFTQVGVPEPQAKALALAYLVLIWINALFGGIIYFLQSLRESQSRDRYA